MRKSLNRSLRAGPQFAIRHARSPRAFTLIEIMIVVAIAALVMAISVPFVYRAINKDPISQAASDVLEACHNARAQAILRGVPTELRFRPQEGLVQVVIASGARSSDGAIDPTTGETQTPSGSALFSAHLSDKIVIEELAVNFLPLKDEEEARVRFHPTGTCDEFTIVLQYEQQQWRKISLDVVTGLADMEVVR